tara:strand:+ start:340 stop:660 length:321 start_codon:yes stop_codon:yes gene_type:complete
MLILSRRPGQSIMIAEDITITVVDKHGKDKVSINVKKFGFKHFFSHLLNKYSVTELYKIGETFSPCENVMITLMQYDSYGNIRLGITAPRYISIDREEVRAKKVMG